MPENSTSRNPSHPSQPQDQYEGPWKSIGIFMRNARSHLMGFLSRLSLGSYVGLIIGVMGILFYTGYHLRQSGNPALPTKTTGLSDSGEKIRKLETDLLVVKNELQERMKSYEGLLKEREAQIKERENVISSLRNEIKELQSKLIAEQNENAELVTQPGSSEPTISEFLSERVSLPKPLRHKGFLMKFGTIIAPKSYLIWAPENVNVKENGLYIDGTHFALYKCLQKIEPMDLLGEAGRKNLFFAITAGEKVLSPIPYLNLLPVEEGKHKIRIQPLSGSAEEHPKETVVKLMARQVEFIEIDGIDVLGVEGGARVKLKTLDHESTVQRLSKVLERMHVDNDCLLEILTPK